MDFFKIRAAGFRKYDEPRNNYLKNVYKFRKDHVTKASLKLLNKSISRQIIIEKSREINDVITKEGPWQGLKKLIPTKKSTSHSSTPIINDLNEVNVFFSKMGNE